MLDIHVNQLAYCKMVLHLAKYPHLSLNGILLSKRGRNTQSAVHIVDCIPLFHSSLTLASPFEIAMNQIDVYCQQRGLEIIGHYHSTENISDNQPNVVTYKMAEKLKEACAQSFVFMIDNQKVSPLHHEPCFKVYSYDQKMKDVSCNYKIDGVAYDTCSRLLNEKKYHSLNDFDNHLDNIALDWRNLDLNKLMPTELGLLEETVDSLSSEKRDD